MSGAELARAFAKISLLTFGGGYAMVPLFESEIVTRQGWLTTEAFANLVGLAQVTPGPIGFNAATYVGMSQGGWTGALAASAGVVLPSLVLALGAAVCLRKAAKAAWLKTLMQGVRPCVVGIIASAVVFFADTSVFTSPLSAALRDGEFGVCWQGAAIFAAVLIFRWKLPKANPVVSLVLAALLGYVLFI